MIGFQKKLSELELILSKSIGEFNLFGLFEREDIPNRYDLLFSTSLNGRNKNELFKILHKEIRNHLSNDELIMISRFVFLEPNSPFVQTINGFTNIKNGCVEIVNSSFNNVLIKHAYIVTSQRMKSK